MRQRKDSFVMWLHGRHSKLWACFMFLVSMQQGWWDSAVELAFGKSSDYIVIHTVCSYKYDENETYISFRL